MLHHSNSKRDRPHWQRIASPYSSVEELEDLVQLEKRIWVVDQFGKEGTSDFRQSNGARVPFIVQFKVPQKGTTYECPVGLSSAL